MRLLGLTALLTAAGAAAEIPVWAYIAGLVLPAIVSARWYARRESKRLIAAQGTTELATAHLTEQQADKIQEEIRLSVLESVRDDMARQREETARAQASEKEAIAEVAILIAQHARDRAEWKDERHDFINALRERDNQITLLRAEVEGLREEVYTLRVALGVEQERRVDDLRMTSLEHRAQVSEDKADVAKKRADDAAENAEVQEHRNDDTLGHA